MTDRKKFEQMLELLINEETEKAKELFHDIVVEKSREIYESLLESDFDQEETTEGMEEEEPTDESMEELPTEAADDEEDSEEPEMDGDDMGGDDMGDMDDMGGEEDPMMEAITLKKVSVTHGDNGVQNKSTVDANSGQAGMDSRPVKFSGASESVPTGPKGPSNAYAKGETSVKGAGSFKNAPAQNNADLTAAPKPVTKDEAGKVRSPVAESRRTPAKRRI